MTSEKRRVKDLQPLDMKGLTWDGNHAPESIQELYDRVQKKVRDAIYWYIEKRKTPKRWAQIFRLFGILFAIFGGLAPVVSLVWTDLPSEWGYLFFAVAAGCLFCNRALGASSSWIRYITTTFQLESALESFEFEWRELLTEMGGKPNNGDEVKKLLKTLKTFTEKVNHLLVEEIQTWARQFNEDLAMLEKTIHAKGKK